MDTLKESCYQKINVMHVPSETAQSLYYYIQWTGHFLCKEDFYINRSCFNSFLFLYTLSGSGTLLYDGRKYDLPPKSVTLIDCRKPHEYFPNGEGWEFKYVHFNGAQSQEYYRYITEIYGAAVITGIDDGEKYFDRFIDLVRTVGAEEICSDMLYHFLMKLIHTGSTDARTNQTYFKIQEVLSYIAENFNQDLCVSTLAELVHLSRCHFSVEFKKQTGFSPYSYILNYRIATAKQMLYTTNHSVEYISAYCGFPAPSSFIRAFKRLVGVSPAIYRREGQP